MNWEPLDASDVTFTIHADYEDCPVRGNVLASGEDEEDLKCENEIIARLDRGDVWAWASVEVRATWESPDGTEYHASDYLGGCTYADERDFVRANDYYSDMCACALDQLNCDMAARVASLQGRIKP